MIVSTSLPFLPCSVFAYSLHMSIFSLCMRGGLEDKNDLCIVLCAYEILFFLNDIISVFPRKKGGGGVTVNVLMYNYQYCFNT